MDRIRATGGEVKVVLQSDPTLLAEELGSPEVYPFEIICDPDGVLYQLFEVNPAASMAELGGGNVLEKIKAAKERGLTHGRYEGIEEQLPAALLSTVICPLLTHIMAKTAAISPMLVRWQSC